jgi:hypothetical protein
LTLHFLLHREQSTESKLRSGCYAVKINVRNAPLRIPNEPRFAIRGHIVLLHDYEPRGAVIDQLKATQETLAKLLALLESSEA